MLRYDPMLQIEPNEPKQSVAPRHEGLETLGAGLDEIGVSMEWLRDHYARAEGRFS